MYDDDDPLRLGKSSGGRQDQGGGRRFAILRCAKIKNLGNMGASLQHTFRERETPNADPARIRNNTVLVGAEDSRGVLDAWRDRAPEKIRANAVHGLEYFIGGSPGALNAMSREDQDAYFRRALDWLEERHGKENVLSAVIHRDEATPHMTVMTIPLDDRGRLNARALVGDRGKLSAMQTDFAERVGKPHGLERGVEGSKATHERVQRAYAHLNDPEHAVELPARLTGGFLGRGKETDEEWRRRASQAATDALRGAWTALHRERRDHAARISELRGELAYERARNGPDEALELNQKLLAENTALRQHINALEDEADGLAQEAAQWKQKSESAHYMARAILLAGKGVVRELGGDQNAIGVRAKAMLVEERERHRPEVDDEGHG